MKNLQISESDVSGGLQTRFIIDRVDRTSDKINALAELQWQWRSQLKEMLSSELTSEEADADDYQKRAEQEEKVDVLLDSYRTLL